MVHIAEREIQLPEAVIAKLLRLAAEDERVISLGPGEPDFPAPPPIVELTKKYADQCNHYSPPGGRHELKEAIVKKLKKENKIDAHPSNIIVTCGSQEALLLATACTLDVGEQVIIPNPSFLGYLPMFELFDAFPVALELRGDEGWEVNVERLKGLIDWKKTKAIMLNTPANPTGTVMSKKVMEEVADLAVEYDVYIFSDEAYERLVYGGKKHISIGSLNGMQDKVVSFYTFSKTFAMCGYRVGYAVGPRNLIEAMTKTHIYTTLCAPTLSQMVAAEALTIPARYIERMVHEYDRRRTFIVKRLQGMGLQTVVPYGAFYTFSTIQHVHDNSFQFAYDLLKQAKVAVMPGREFGRYGEGYIRCSYATELPAIEEAMDRLESYVKKHRRR